MTTEKTIEEIEDQMTERIPLTVTLKSCLFTVEGEAKMPNGGYAYKFEAGHPSDADEPKIENPVTKTTRELCALVWQRGREAPLTKVNPFLSDDPTIPDSLREMCADIWRDGHESEGNDLNPYTVAVSRQEYSQLCFPFDLKKVST
jgi:hypothetical protein